MQLFSAGWVKAAAVTRSRRLPRRLSVAGAAVLIGMLALLLAVDIPLERRLSSVPKRGAVADLLEVAEVFGNGFGVLLTLAAVAILDRGRRRQTGRLALCALGAGFAANVVKALVPRTRPYAADLETGAVGDTFLGWVPLLERVSDMRSFPSAHTATAAGLAVGLAAIYPQGRRLFAGLVAGVATQRMLVGAHFPSDVLAGAAVGWTWAAACQPGRAIGRRYTAAAAWVGGRLRSRAGEASPATHADGPRAPSVPGVVAMQATAERPPAAGGASQPAGRSQPLPVKRAA